MRFQTPPGSFHRARPRRFTFAALLGFVMLFVVFGAARSSDEAAPVKTIREARRDGWHAVAPIPVELDAIVTHATPPGYSPPELVVQDATGGIWLTGPAVSAMAHQPGQHLRVRGKAVPGIYAPRIEVESIEPLPASGTISPVPVTADQLISGAFDSRYVAIAGRVHAVRELSFEGSPWTLVSMGYRNSRMTVLIPGKMTEARAAWIDAEARISGVCAHYFNPEGQILNAQIRSSNENQVTLEQPGLDEKEVPTVSVRDVLKFDPAIDLRRRIRVKGVVALQHREHWIALTDGDRTIRVWPTPGDWRSTGDLIEVTGFAYPSNGAPQIEDAVVRVLGKSASPVARKSDPKTAMEQGGSLLRIAGRIETIQPMAEFTRLSLLNGNENFVVDVPGTPSRLPAPVEPGAEVDATGICVLTMGTEADFGSYPPIIAFRLEARGPGDFVVLRPASWWTPQRMRVASLGLACLSCALAALWFRQHVRTTRLAIAKEEISAVRDVLAKTVDARTGQLGEQILEQHRMKSETEAVLAERARLARDLHDSIGQTLASAKWRVEALSEGTETAPPHAAQLRAVFGLLDSCQKDLQRSVWNLRNPDLDHEHLVDTVRECVRVLLDGTGVLATVEVGGAPKSLPMLVETNLLRCVQEAIANVLKHSRAKRVEVQLSYLDEGVLLRVRDDGVGFSVERLPEFAANGHFGIHAMRERVARLGGTLRVIAAVGKGSEIVIEAPADFEMHAASNLANAEREPAPMT